jgi:hypothetical protein
MEGAFEDENVQNISFAQPERKALYGRSKPICEDTIKMGAKETGWVDAGLLQKERDTVLSFLKR